MDPILLAVVVVLVLGAAAAIFKRGWIKARFGAANGVGRRVERWPDASAACAWAGCCPRRDLPGWQGVCDGSWWRDGRAGAGPR